ncbi:MAG TPA: hypothetical protein VLA13_03100, partial [Massilibacterium sp.]|nr:hypothetical protein [Massilibacterium sp.]
MWMVLGLIGIVLFFKSIKSLRNKEKEGSKVGSYIMLAIAVLFIGAANNLNKDIEIKEVSNQPKKEVAKKEVVKKEETLEQKVKKIAEKELGKDNVIEANYYKDTKHVSIKYKGHDGLKKESIKMNNFVSITDMLKEIKKLKEVESVYFGVDFPMADQYGNESTSTILKITFNRETLEK